MQMIRTLTIKVEIFIKSNKKMKFKKPHAAVKNLNNLFIIFVKLHFFLLFTPMN